MEAIAIHSEIIDPSQARFRAIAGSHQSVGRTAGEALDSLLAQEGQRVESSMILIQRFAPDSFFTQAQYDRMQELLDRRPSLTSEESDELDELVDLEVEATVSRSEALLKLRQP